MPSLTDENTKENIRKIVNTLKDLTVFPPFGSVVRVEFTASTPRKVYHGLGYKPNGFIVIRNTLSSVVYEASISLDESKYLNLQHGSSDSIVTIWFF
jgi:hypothetical protein